MGRTPCCSYAGMKKGLWTPEEDLRLIKYVDAHGEGNWQTLSKKAGLLRCGKGCRLRWMNYLRPNVKRGDISPEEEEMIIRLHNLLGNRWSLIAGRIPGRTDNEVKNYWNTHLSKRFNTSKMPHHNLTSKPQKQPGSFEHPYEDKKRKETCKTHCVHRKPYASNARTTVKEQGGSAFSSVEELDNFLMETVEVYDPRVHVAHDSKPIENLNHLIHCSDDLAASGDFSNVIINNVNTAPWSYEDYLSSMSLSSLVNQPAFDLKMSDKFVPGNINYVVNATGNYSNMQFNNLASEAQSSVQIPSFGGGIEYEEELGKNIMANSSFSMRDEYSKPFFCLFD